MLFFFFFLIRFTGSAEPSTANHLVFWSSFRRHLQPRKFQQNVAHPHVKCSSGTRQTRPQDGEADRGVDIGSVACPDIRSRRHYVERKVTIASRSLRYGKTTKLTSRTVIEQNRLLLIFMRWPFCWMPNYFLVCLIIE